MKPIKNSRKYAKMYLGAVGMDNAPKALKDLETACDLMDRAPEFRRLLRNPMFSETERTEAIAAVGAKLGFQAEAVKFLNFLADKGATHGLGAITAKAGAIYSESKGVVKATVVTPVAIGTGYDARLKTALMKMTGKDVEIEYATDPSLLGGVLVRVGSTMYDGTVKGQLRILRDELLKG